MFKKNFLLLCALTAVYAPVAIAEECFRDDEIVDVTKGKKCCKCCSLTVTRNASIGGNLTVGGSVTAASFILASGDTLFNGLRNWAVFSNTSTQAGGTSAIIPFGGTPLFNNKGITNAAGVITLPNPGIFLVLYTVKIEWAEDDTETAFATLQQTVTGAGSQVDIGQPAIISSTQTTVVGEVLQTQITGWAIVTTTSTANNQIDLFLNTPTGTSLPAPVITGDANAEIAIIQLN
jgi:hypothetical protein